MNNKTERTAIIKTTLGEIPLDFDDLRKGDIFYLLEPDGTRVPKMNWLVAESNAECNGICAWEDEGIVD